MLLFNLTKFMGLNLLFLCDGKDNIAVVLIGSYIWKYNSVYCKWTYHECKNFPS